MREQVKFIRHLLFHPIDGFYDMKVERKGSLKASFILIFLAFLMLNIKSGASGFVYNNNYGQPTNIVLMFFIVVVPVLLFSIANLSITTLMDGEGKFVDIFMVTSYSLTPLILIWPIETILSNVFTLDEASYMGFLTAISIIWVAYMLFFGILSIHNYTPLKNVGTFILTAIAMIIIIFLILLFFNLFSEIVGFGYSLTKEIGTI